MSFKITKYLQIKYFKEFLINTLSFASCIFSIKSQKRSLEFDSLKTIYTHNFVYRSND